MRRGSRPIVVAAVGLVTTVAVALVVATPPGGSPAGASTRIDVVASFYPLAEAAARVGGRRVDVSDLTPPGVEPHDLELSTKDIDAIDGASLVIVLGDGFQPAVEEAAERRDGRTLVVFDRVSGSRRVDDPHVWLDPVRMAGIVDATAAALAKVDPPHAAKYRARAAAYTEELAALDDEYRAGLASCRRRLVVTSHQAFGYLAEAYGLTQEGVGGLDPEVEPDPKRLGELADLAREEGVTTIFTEELVSPRVARTLAREAGGLRVDVLNPLEGLTRRQEERGDDYLSVMRDNLARLRRALDCQ